MVLGRRSKKCKCGNDHASLDAVRKCVRAFVEGAADPSNPRCCTLCFFVTIIGACGACSIVLDDIKINQQDVFAACLALLVEFPRWPVARIRACLRTGARNCRERHDYQITPALCYESFVGNLMLFLFCALIQGSRPVDEYPVTRAGGHWPTHQDQLVPHGAAADMDALVYWCGVLPTFAPFALLGTYLRAISSVVLPALLASPRRERLAWAIATGLSARPVADSTWPGGAPLVLPADLVRDTSGCGAPLVANWVMVVVYGVHAESNCGSDELFRLVRGFENQLLGPAAALGNAMQHFTTARAREAVRPFVQMLRGLARGTFDDSLLNEQPTVRLSWEFFNLVDRQYGVCSYAGCRAPELAEGSARRFQHCGVCRVPRYCDRTCQRADWGSGPAPHKHVCPVVARLKTIMATRGNCDWSTYRRVWDECALAEADVALLRAWVLASGVLSPVNL